MNNSNKTYIFAIFLFLLGIAASVYFFYGGNSNYRQELKALHEDNKRLESQIEARDKIIQDEQESRKKLVAKDSLLSLQISAKEAEIASLKDKADKSLKELEKLLAELRKVQAQIEHLKNNPPNRVGDDLINSLKIKTFK